MCLKTAAAGRVQLTCRRWLLEFFSEVDAARRAAYDGPVSLRPYARTKKRGPGVQ